MPPVHSSIAHPASVIVAKSGGAAEKAMASSPDLVSRRTAALNALLHDASPEEILAAACDTAGPGRLAVVSSFGTESAVMLAAAAAVDPAIPVLLIDTGYLFPETLAYRDMLRDRLGLRDVRAIRPDGEELAAEDAEGDLYARDPDSCCALRKVRPLAKALAGFEGWANGRKRFQGAARTSIPIAEADGPRLKVNPLALLSPEEIAQRFRALDLPPHPLEKFGFRSIGCMPCTTATRPGEDPRAGRWRGRGKVECGIHTGLAAKA
jgi:phosphoadenosine phosphosulfate reductase